MNAQQKKISDRIRALMAKTIENGATEAEAIAAMQKAREMIDKYGLTLEAIEAGADTIDRHEVKRDNYKTFIIKDWLAEQVARYCDCKVWMSRKDGTITFFGAETDRQFAAWLLESLDLFVRNQTVRYMQAQNYANGAGPWDLQKGFMMGCVSRIAHRLYLLSEERSRSASSAGNGKSLVIVKMQLVNRAFASLGMRLRNTSTKRTRGNSQAFGAGVAAGDRATFNQPINGGNAVHAIAG